jgi:carbamoyltransferase
MITVSISVQFHSASLCILRNSDIIFFIQEERLSRIKYDSSFPLQCLNYITKYTKDIDNLCIVNITEEQKNIILNEIESKKIKYKNLIINDDEHHLYHAASAFYSSGFKESACIIIDGAGVSFRLSDLTVGTETTSIYYAKYPSEFTPVFKNLRYDCTMLDEYLVFNESEVEKMYDYDVYLNDHLDIGMMYGTISNHLGFSFKGQGKIMGLSSYGKENLDIPPMLCENTIISNSNLFKNNRTLNTKIYPKLKNTSNFEFNADLCFALQKSLESIFLDRVEYTIKKTKCKNIVFSGGCALNIVGNSLIKEKFPEINFFIDPIAEDASQSLGSAKFYYHKISKDMTPNKLNSIYLGPEYDKEVVRKKIISEIKKSKKIYS